MTEFEEKVEKFRQKKAKNISIAVMLYILSVVAVIAFPCLLPFNGGIIGVLVMLSMIAFATGLIIYTSMTIPRDVANVLSSGDSVTKEIISSDGTKVIYRENMNPIIESILKMYWLIVTIIYLGVSFFTGAWAFTWLIWLIATALEQGIRILLSLNNSSQENKND